MAKLAIVRGEKLMSRGNKVLVAALAAFCSLGVAQATSEKSAVSPSTTTEPADNPSAPHPNILFVIMDDENSASALARLWLGDVAPSKWIA